MLPQGSGVCDPKPTMSVVARKEYNDLQAKKKTCKQGKKKNVGKQSFSLKCRRFTYGSITTCCNNYSKKLLFQERNLTLGQKVPLKLILLRDMWRALSSLLWSTHYIAKV